MNVKKLRGKMVEHDISVELLSEHMGCSASTMYRKLDNFEKITIGEAEKIRQYVPMSDDDAKDIFLN